jgi:replicative DNA helicase
MIKSKALIKQILVCIMTFDDLWKDVQEGKKGYNIGLSTGLTKLEEYTYGIQKKTYTIIFGEPGTGKSSLAISNYICYPVYHVIKENQKINLKIKYYSLEVSKSKVLAKIACWLLYQEYHLVVPPSLLLSKGSMLISKHIENRLFSIKGLINEMLQYIEILDEPAKPSDIKKQITNFANTRGKFYRDASNDLQYRPNDSKEHIILIFDTLSNLLLEAEGSSSSRKTTIDIHSGNCRYFYRNVLNYSVFNIMHSNRAMSSMERARFGEIAPKQEDIKDSSVPAQDANLVIAIFNPHSHMNDNNLLSKYAGFDIARLKERFKSLILCKNRDGENNLRVGCMFLGEIGYFQELGHSSLMDETKYIAIEKIKASCNLREK